MRRGAVALGVAFGFVLAGCGTPQASYDVIGPTAPRTQDLPAIVVFVLEDGQRVAIPIFCPRGGTTTDNACNPRVQ